MMCRCRLLMTCIDMEQIAYSKSPVREIRTPGSVQGRWGNPASTAITDDPASQEIETV
jgi:hypothetical protein